MKKRILSFLLVLCTLLTMVPVMTQAAENTEEVASTEATNADYANLYEQTGLVHAYMAFGFSDASYDLTAGVWYDLVGSANASFTGGAYSNTNPTGWQVGPYGGAMYVDNDAYRATGQSVRWTVGEGEGQLNLPETYTVEYLSRNELRDVHAGWSTSKLTSEAVADSTDTLYKASVANWRAGYGKYIITFKGTAGTKYSFTLNGTTTGNTTIGADGTHQYAGTLPTGKTELTIQVPAGLTVDSVKYTAASNEYQADGAFAFGNLRALAWTNTLGVNSWGNGFGSVRWFAAQKNWGGNGNNCVTIASEDRTLANHDGRTMPMTVVKTNMEVADVGMSEKYVLTMGTKTFGTGTYTYTPDATNSVKNDTSGAGLLTNATSVFQVQGNLPGVVYSLRMYDCEISAAAKKLNHLVDILAYARFDIDTYEALSADEKTALANFYADVDLESVDADQIANVIARIKGTKDSTDTLYVQNGLVALYLADNIDITNAVWYNSVVGGANATLKGWWSKNTDGTAHVNKDLYGTVMPDGTMSTSAFGTKVGNTWDSVGSYLDLGIANLPDADFTVSATAAYENIQSRDFQTGAIVNGWTTARTPRGGGEDTGVRLRLGFFTTNMAIVGTGGQARWYYTPTGWQSCGDWGGTMYPSQTTSFFKSKLNGSFYTETVTRDETTAADATTAVYTVYQDTARKIQGTFSSANSKAPIYSLDESTGAFNLFKLFPADVVSVTVYTRALTTEELAQNKVADLVEYYHLDVSALLEDGAEAQLAELMSAAANWRLDSSNYDLNKKQYQAFVDTLGKEVVKTTYDELYVTDGLVGLYTMFDVAEAEQVMLSGKWMNKAYTEGGAGEYATVKGPMYHYDEAVSANWGWQVGANGGLKTSYLGAVWQTYVKAKNSDNGAFTGIVLDPALLAYDKSTVEVVMSIEDLLNVNGTIWENTGTIYNQSDATFAVGSWRATAFFGKGNGNYGQDRWAYYNGYWGNHNANDYAAGALWPKTRLNHPATEVVTYTMMQEVTRAAEEGGLSTSKFTVSWNISTGVGSDVSERAFFEPGVGVFKVLNGIGGSIYAVRVYSDVLTVAEQQQNHFIDLLAYHGINPAKVKVLTPEQLALGAAYFANFTLDQASEEILSYFVSSLDSSLAKESLYVTDGIVGLFTAYGNDASVNTAAHTWLNKAGGSTATLKGTWKATADGGITNGPMYYGRANPVGVDYYTGKTIYGRDTSKNNTWNANNYLDLGNAHLPTGDMTVEIVSNYHYVELLADDGSTVPYRVYSTAYWYKKTEGGVTTTVSSSTALQSTDAITYELIGIGYAEAKGYDSETQANAIGNLKAFTAMIGSFEGNTHYANRWYRSAGAGAWGSNVNRIAEKYENAWEDQSGYYTSNPGSIQTKTITKQINSDGSAHIEIGRNFDMIITADPTAAEWYEETSNSPFFLFKHEWVDLYSVRIYSKVLSAEEQIQNRAADMVEYFDLDLTKYNNYTDEIKKNVNKALAALTFNVEKATAQAVIDGGVYSSAAYEAAYVQDGLVALYTSFNANSGNVDIVSGTWANKVANGTDATLIGNGYYWHMGEDGGLTSVMTKQEYSDVRNNMASRTGIVLDDAYANLANVTVEALHKVQPLIDEKTGEAYISAFTASYVDDNGVTVPQAGERYGLHQSYRTYIRMGLFNAFTFAAPRASNDNNSLGYYRWYISNAAYGLHGGVEKAFSKNMSADAHIFNTALKSTTAQYSITTGADNAVTYTVAHNGTVSTTKTLDKATNDALKTAVDGNSNAYSDNSAGGQFAFFRGVPVTVYAIRVYSRALTAAEMAQNHFVDMAAYFGLDLSKLPAEEKETVYAAFAGITVESDADYVKSLYGFYTGDKEALAGSLAEFKGYAPLLGKESGYRVLFGINRGAYDLFTTGYTINYGAVVAIGEWGKDTINTLEDLEVTVSNGTVTTSAPNAKVVVVGGTADGSALYYEDTADQQIFSVAVTADAAEYGAGVLVRGFYTLTDGAGHTTVHYMDPADDVFEGAVSVMEAADYYVNDFDGNVGLAYKYMNTESLTRVLDACGITARKGLGGDLTIYVDAANGNDANNGLTEGAALKTVAAAVEAAKAHLASETATGVVIDLAAGEYNVDKAIELDGKTFANPNASVVFRGEGEDTVLTGEVSIDLSNIQYSDMGGAYVNLKDTAGNIPNFRYLYSGDTLLNVITAGDQENYYDVGTAVVDDTNKTAKIYMDPAIFDGSSDYAGTEVHMLVEWNFNIIHVVSVDYNDYNDSGLIGVYVNYDQFKNMAVYSTANNREYWLANSEGIFNYSALQNGVDGYYYDEKTGDLFVYDLENKGELSYSALENMFILSNINGLVIEDLAITGVDNKYVTEESGLKGGQAGRNGRTNESGNLTENGFLTLAAIHGNNIKNARFEGISIYNVGGDGINLRGIVENVDILSNKIEHVGETAIRIGATNGAKSATAYNKNVTIADNFINGTGEFFKQCCGMLITNGANIKIVGNTIVNTTYTAISIGWVWSETTMQLADVLNGTAWHLVNVEVAYNYISDFMTCMRDGGAIYILGGNAANDVDKYFNFMHDNYLNITEATGKHDGGRWFMGYYHDGASSNWYDFNNVVVNNTTTGVDKFVPYYVQGIANQLSHNVKLYGNYGIGFANGEALYRQADRINAGRNVIANDYIFSDKAMTNNVVGSQFGNSTSIAAPANAKALVSSIFLSAGSSINSSVKATGSSAITGGTKNAWDLVLGGGNADLGDITGDLEAPVYQVTVMADGKVYETYDVASGSAFTLPAELAEPTKARGEHSSFVFTGWNNYTAGMTIVSNITIEAEFEEVIDEYTITVVIEGETTEIKVPYGATLGDYLAELETPVKEQSDYYVYTFRDWYNTDSHETGSVVTGETVVGDMTVYAVFTPAARKYYAPFYVKDLETGELVKLGTITANYNERDNYRNLDVASQFTIFAGEYKDTNKDAYDAFMAQYMPADTDDIKYSYSNKFTCISGDGEFRFDNSTGVNSYYFWRFIIREDGTSFLLTFDESYRITINGEEQWLNKGETLDIAALAGEGFNVTSVLVNGQLVEGTSIEVTDDLAGATIEYSTAAKSYTVTFKNEDGSTFATETFTHGAELVLPEEVPTKESDETYDYVFAGWAEYDYENGMIVTSDLEFTATFDAVEKPEDLYAAGDVNGDQFVDAADVDWVFQIIAGTMDESDALGLADLTNDGFIDAADVDWLFQIIAGTRDGETLEPIA